VINLHPMQAGSSSTMATSVLTVPLARSAARRRSDESKRHAEPCDRRLLATPEATPLEIRERMSGTYALRCVLEHRRSD